MAGNGKLIFTDVMGEGLMLSKNTIQTQTKQKSYPDYLKIIDTVYLDIDSRIDPANLCKNYVYIYNDNLYATDDNGNIAYIDCEMIHTDNVADIKSKHREYKSVGGNRAQRKNMDAGHFGVALGQHPSIAMEQDAIMNRYGSWRKFERDWDKLSRKGHAVNVKAVFVNDQGAGTFSPFWCIRETIDDREILEFVLTNEADQY